MNKSKLLIAILTAGLVSSQAAVADMGGDNWSISGWINESMLYYDDGQGSDIVQLSDNGTTLGSRVTLAGNADVSSGLNVGFELILEPQSKNTPLIFSGQESSLSNSFLDDDRGAAFDGAPIGDSNGHKLRVLGNSLNMSGGFGKITVGLQSMPTDNIAVLEDPSLTLWASISPVFRGNGFTIRRGPDAEGTYYWGSFMSCLGEPGLRGPGGIGIDCNGVYRNGLRYDLPELFPGMGVAVGYANDDIFDVAVKWKGGMGGLNTQLALGYAMNQSNTWGGAGAESETFQMQAGAMHADTGVFGSIAYQNEQLDGNVAANDGDDTDAYWLKVGIKKAFNSMGDTSIAFQYGSYNDQYGVTGAHGITGSEVERIGFEVNQYFGSRFIMYGVWENLSLDVDCVDAAVCSAQFGGAEDLDTFTMGGVFFF